MAPLIHMLHEAAGWLAEVRRRSARLGDGVQPCHTGGRAKESGFGAPRVVGMADGAGGSVQCRLRRCEWGRLGVDAGACFCSK